MGTDIWFQTWLKASAIPPVTTANPTKDPTRNPTMIPTADPTPAFVLHHNGAWCTSNGKIALTPKENYEKVDAPHISEAACRARCEADAQCDFAQTLNHLAYASGWPRMCQLHRNAYCDPEKLITTDIWYQVWIKGSAIAPPTMEPTKNPTMIPTASPSSSPTREPSMNPTLSPTANPSPFPTAADFIIKIKGFHGKPNDVLDSDKIEAQSEVDVDLYSFEQKLTPLNGDPTDRQ